MTIQQLAKKYYDMFEIRERNTPSGIECFICLIDEITLNPNYYENSEIWILIRDIHVAMVGGFPKDYIYDYIYDAFYQIREHEDIDDIILKADINYNELFNWAKENIHVIDENPLRSDVGIVERISYAQVRQREEVLHMVRQFLETQLKETDNVES